MPNDGPEIVAPVFRRLDHVAVAVRDTEKALRYFCDRLGLAVLHTEAVDVPPAVLTYLRAGDVLLQLIAPRGTNSDIATWLDEHGEGVHHLCFSVDDVADTVQALSDPGAATPLGQGRGRISGFVQNGMPHGVLIECTEFGRQPIGRDTE
jgi:methylmalonyl-CoA/ethylmalonyl-CoA epimerase